MSRRQILRMVAGSACAWTLTQSAQAREASPADFQLRPGQASLALSDVALLDLSGRPAALRDQAGRVVLLHVFATWCEPCREELPLLSALATKPDGPDLYAVSLAEPPQRVERFLERLDLPIRAMLDMDRALSRRIGVGVLPSTLVLAPGLSPVGFAEGDVDWTRPDIRDWLIALSKSVPDPEVISNGVAP
ncbi:MAG: TlpA disulfide reductase family protein [Alsobacter sp.]